MREEVRNTGDLVVGGGAAQLFLGDLFVRDGADDIRPGDEHVGGLVDHEDEVGDGGRVDSAAGAGAHDGGELRHDAGGKRVAQKDVRIAGERDDALLNARPAGVVQPDDGAPTRMAVSMILTILAALDSDSEPPKTVKSWA